MNRPGIDIICQNCICFAPALMRITKMVHEAKGEVGCKYSHSCKKLYDYRKAQEDK